MKNIKTWHIATIILGIIFILLGSFHTTIWFDESYSIAISNNHNFLEIWQIGGHDVHPVFYYWMLKILSLIFGNNILVYRLFSALALCILSILGYTHIRKDFGEKTGLLFSFFTLFMPVCVAYSGEIRMYTWGMLFVTIMAIYAYRIYKGNSSIKNWIIFALFSLISAYTHYYGLMAAGIVNAFLLVFLIIEAVKRKSWTKELTCFTVQGVIEILLYIPWVLSLLLQISQVSNGFWIKFEFPKSIIDMFIFQFTGNLNVTYINNWAAGIFGLIVFISIIYLLIKKRKEETGPAVKAIIVYAGVILGASVVSILMNRPIIYARYFLLITGLFIFFISYVLGKLGNNKLNIAICLLTIIISIIVNINVITINYDSTNKEPIEYVKQNIQEGDILVYGNEGSGFVVSANFSEYEQYFYDYENWRVEEAYKAYGPKMETVYDLDMLEDYTGRIWFISGNYALTEEAMQKYGDINIIEQKVFNTKFKNYKYTFAITQKGESK